MKVHRSVSALIALAVLIPTMLLGVMVWREFGHVLHNAETAASHSAALLTQHVEKVMESNDLILDRVLERISGKDWAAVDDEERGIHEFLQAIAHASPQVSNILLFDAAGTPRAQALRYPAPRNVNVSDRDYFVDIKQLIAAPSSAS
jgi:two-component system, NtrC family, sensor kinase